MAYSIPAEITNEIAMVVKNAGSGGSVQSIYSTTPHQIGVWPDGTPVWREVIVYELEEIDVSDGSCTAGCKLKTAWDAIILSASAVQCTSDSDYTNNLPIDYDRMTGEFIIDKMGYEIDGLKYICGCMEYVTPASNIRA